MLTTTYNYMCTWERVCLKKPVDVVVILILILILLLTWVCMPVDARRRTEQNSSKRQPCPSVASCDPCCPVVPISIADLSLCMRTCSYWGACSSCLMN